MNASISLFDIIKLHIFLLLLLSGSSAEGQRWQRISIFGGSGNETCDGLELDAQGNNFVVGTFDKTFSYTDQTLQSKGEEDIFLFKTGDTPWAKRMGSTLDDEVADIAVDGNGHLLLTGTYWIEGDFDTLKILAKRNPKAGFIAKFNANGRVLWAKSLDGGALKGMAEVACDFDNNIFLAGFFSDSLFIADTILVAKGKTDLFVAKFSATGDFCWATRAGYRGDTRGTAMGITAGGDAVVAGFFNDTTQFNTTVLTANTFDRDVFVARFDQNGALLWAKKAGGVQDDDAVALTLDENDSIYLTGYFVGVMRLGETLQIQSSSGFADFFVAMYDPSGNPLRARALGGSQLQQATAIAYANNQIIVSGFYQGMMNIDGYQFQAGAGFGSFLIGLDKNFNAIWAKDIRSNNGAFASQVIVNQFDEVVLGGSFLGAINFDGNTQLADSDFDIFLATLGNPLTNLNAPQQESRLFQLLSNPAKTEIRIQTSLKNFELRLFNSEGKSIRYCQDCQFMPVGGLPGGSYWLVLQSEGKIQTQQVILAK